MFSLTPGGTDANLANLVLLIKYCRTGTSC
jgi:hypothetical protein